VNLLFSDCGGWRLKNLGGPPHSKTLARFPAALKHREASGLRRVYRRFQVRDDRPLPPAIRRFTPAIIPLHNSRCLLNYVIINSLGMSVTTLHE